MSLSSTAGLKFSYNKIVNEKKLFLIFRDNLVANKQVVQSLQNFQKLNKDNMVANPIYDMLRSFNMQMDSNPKSKSKYGI